MNSEEIRQQISEIEKLYENARFKEAYGKFNELCSSYPAYSDRSITILVSFNDLNNQIIQGSIRYEDQTNAKQQIGNRFLMCLRQFKEENLVSPDLSKLISILSETGLSDDELKKTYNACIPKNIRKIKTPETSEDIIIFLSDMPLQTDNTLPLTNFVRIIAERTENQQVAEKLNEWINVFVLEYESKHNNLKIKMKHDEQPQSLPIHLLVRLIPNPGNRSKEAHELFTVEIHSWKNPNDVECKNRTENCLLTDVRKKLDEFILSEFDEDDEIRTMPIRLTQVKVLVYDLIYVSLSENSDRISTSLSR